MFLIDENLTIREAMRTVLRSLLWQSVNYVSRCTAFKYNHIITNAYITVEN